jgi:predicted nucleic acid-binding protein
LNSGRIRVVFDINVYVDAISNQNSTFPYLSSVPPKTSNAAADCLSLALDDEDFNLFVSPHILLNITRVLRDEMKIKPERVEAILTAFTEIVHCTEGSIVEPPRANHDQKDFEDNLILDLVRHTESLILVTSDEELLKQSPWNGRLILSPRRFVEQIIGSRTKLR